ncbi:MAG: phosphate/phosphite/phosphonate ABC transporter substrate-binding protein [Hyphomicrobiaceae bacterium]|nr:phosphate/phosphite/phosphonate ABC transporter substrate-binding protein [Hyphomicrobiaceae bacterium]
MIPLYTGPKMDFSKVQSEFRVGFLGDEAAQDIVTRTNCLKAYIKAAYQVPVKIFTFKDYAGTMETMLGGNLDYAWFGSSGYAGMYIEDPKAVVPILTRMHPSGVAGYYSVMIARKDSGIRTLADARGKKLGFADPNSTSGYLIPSIELAEFDEVKKAGGVDKYFASTTFQGGHENNILAVLNGDIDLAVTWVSGVGEWSEGYSAGNLKKIVDKGILNMDDIVQIWSSKLIPNGPIVMPTRLPEKARDIMVGMKKWIHKNDKTCSENIANGQVKDWIKVDHSFYESVVRARKAKIGARNKH